jgi:hypothetical protein
MRLTAFCQTAALLLSIVTSAFDVYMYSPAEIKDDIRIYGKKSSDGDVIEMSRALYYTSEDNQPDGCFNQIYQWHQECKNRPLYSLIEKISFDSPTDQPRNLKISTPGYDLSVSSQSASFKACLG